MRREPPRGQARGTRPAPPVDLPVTVQIPLGDEPEHPFANLGGDRLLEVVSVQLIWLAHHLPSHFSRHWERRFALVPREVDVLHVSRVEEDIYLL